MDLRKHTAFLVDGCICPIFGRLEVEFRGPVG